MKSQADERIIVDIGGQEAQVFAESRLEGKVFLCIRPEDVTLSASFDMPKDSSARNRYRGKVIKIVSQGDRQKVILDSGFTLIAYITNEAKKELGLKVGKELVAHFKANCAHMIRRA